MKRTTRLLLTFALAASVASALPVSAFAGKAELARPVDLQATSGGPTQNSWVGGGAAIGCGFGLRYRFVGGGSPIYNGVTALMCLIMIVDGIMSRS